MNMRRRPLIAGALALMAAPGIVLPQPIAGKVWRIGFLSESWPRGPTSTYFLTATGYVEGRDFVFDYKFAQGQRNRIRLPCSALLHLVVSSAYRCRRIIRSAALYADPPTRR